MAHPLKRPPSYADAQRPPSPPAGQPSESSSSAAGDDKGGDEKGSDSGEDTDEFAVVAATRHVPPSRDDDCECTLCGDPILVGELRYRDCNQHHDCQLANKAKDRLMKSNSKAIMGCDSRRYGVQWAQSPKYVNPKQSKAKQSKAKQRKAKQSEAKQSKVKQSKGRQSNARQN